ncbi:Retrotransposable element Tf2 [Gossypium australe]|uniref:Retrotransposable element Tf2 n=1 Tax=Gossypium australe TaxID=47621 RepID=A0A5B6VJQ2_9ROSI|nr:Retrotransposable element Tf2 [Gossypium australe]
MLSTRAISGRPSGATRRRRRPPKNVGKKSAAAIGRANCCVDLGGRASSVHGLQRACVVHPLRDKGIKTLSILMALEGVTTRMQKELGMMQGELTQLQVEFTQLDTRIDARLKDFQEGIKSEVRSEFHDGFLSLLNRMNLPQTYALSIFISNSKLEIGQYLRLFKPQTLVEGYNLVRQVENIMLGPGHNTISFPTVIGHTEVAVLVDSGNTHNFIDFKMAKRLNLAVESGSTLRVMVANRVRLSTQGLCRTVSWEAQGYNFTTDFLILSVKGFDLVLGIHWLLSLSPIVWNFSNLTMQFNHMGQNCILQGIVLGSLHIVPNSQLSKCMSLTPTGLPPPRLQDHMIPLIDDSKVVKVRPYRYPVVQKIEIEKLIQEMMQAGIVRDNNSPFASPVVEYLGHVISQGVVSMDRTKVAGVLDWSPPKSVKELALRIQWQTLCLGNLMTTLINSSNVKEVLTLLGLRHIFSLFHNNAMGGHSGIHATHHKIFVLLYWKGLSKDVKHWVWKCVVCQCFKADTSTSPGFLQPLPIPGCAWTVISMDFIKGLPLSQGKYAILIVIDRLTKYGHFIALAYPFTAFTVAQEYLSHIYKLHGIPQSIWYNPTYHSAIQITHYEALYGQDPPLHLPYLPGASLVATVDLILQHREVMRKVLKFHLTRAQDRMKQIADKRWSERDFQVGDLVYLKLQPYRQHSLRKFKNQKLAPLYFGPFPVEACVGEVTYKLLLPPSARIHSTFHVSQLNKHIGSAVSASTLPPLGSDGALLKTSIRVLDKCLVKQGNHAAVEVLVEWANTFPKDSTWENLHDLQRRFPTFDP